MRSRFRPTPARSPPAWRQAPFRPIAAPRWRCTRPSASDCRRSAAGPAVLRSMFSAGRQIPRAGLRYSRCSRPACYSGRLRCGGRGAMQSNEGMQRETHMLKLYYAPGTCALASHIALEEAGAAYETVRLNFKNEDQKKSEYLKINPKARVPSLVNDRGIITETP